jgi:signal-transduction protein with cAMP-binding, CBS, and nucleotidyltransferase domain
VDVSDNDTPPEVRLKFRKGDLIIKESDYGISIYKIISGKVQVFTESQGVETSLATLGSGEILGELVFLAGSGEPRSASVRAVEDSVLEVWHPRILLKEYEQMPAILRFIADQTLRRLLRMNKLVTQLTAKKIKGKGKAKAKEVPKDSWAAKRSYYRKQVNSPCSLRHVRRPAKGKLDGVIKDISMGGVGVVISLTQLKEFPYKKGDEFTVNTTLSSGRDIDFLARIVNVTEGKEPESLFLGMAFTDLSHHTRKELGFFLMP